ncbi:MAG: DUF4174 domain-containing protein [Bacteroidota bacterium]
MNTPPLGEFRWKNRLIIIATQAHTDQLIQAQLDVQAQHMAEWQDRDLVWLRISSSGGLDQTGQAYSAKACRAILKRYGLDDSRSQVILVGKDGEQKMQKFASPFSAEELFNVIDRMPMRRQEMKKGEPKPR